MIMYPVYQYTIQIEFGSCTKRLGTYILEGGGGETQAYNRGQSYHPDTGDSDNSNSFLYYKW